jgi:hypothetical protein
MLARSEQPAKAGAVPVTTRSVVFLDGIDEPHAPATCRVFIHAEQITQMFG